MAELGRKEAEHLIKEILTEYARKIRSAKKEEYIADVQPLFSPDINAFYKLVKSEDMDLYILNRLNDEGIRQLLNDCRRLAKCFELDSYSKIKDFTYEPESPKCRITADSDGKYTAGGSYTFSLEGKDKLGKKWYEPYSVTWHFYKENPVTRKYEEVVSAMSEARALVDLNTWDRSFLVPEKGRYKVTATIFNQAITTGIRSDIVEVCELYFEAEEESNFEDIILSADSWKVYLNEKKEVSKIEYGTDKTKVQIVNSNGTSSEVINIDTEEYKKLGGFAKKLLKAAGLEATSKADLELQNLMLDNGLFYINKKEGWIERKKYFERMTPADFLSIQDYKDVTVNAVYEDTKGELTFTYTAGGKKETLFIIKASNNQKEREYPTDRGTLTSSPMYTMPNNKSEPVVPYKPGKFPKGTWIIESFEESFTEDFGPYKIRTNATRQVVGYKQKYDENNILVDWEKIKNENDENVLYEDGHLLIHGGTGSIIENLTDIQKLDARKGENDYKGTTHGCIRISNLDVYLIVEILGNYLKSKGNIELEVK